MLGNADAMQTQAMWASMPLRNAGAASYGHMRAQRCITCTWLCCRCWWAQMRLGTAGDQLLLRHVGASWLQTLVYLPLCGVGLVPVRLPWGTGDEHLLVIADAQ